MIKYREGYDVDYIRLMELLVESGRNGETGEFKKLVSMVEGSEIVITAWEFDYMVGYAQLSCAEDKCQIKNVMVDSEYRGQGIGKCLVDYILLNNNKSCASLENEAEYLSYFCL